MVTIMPSISSPVTTSIYGSPNLTIAQSCPHRAGSGPPYQNTKGATPVTPVGPVADWDHQPTNTHSTDFPNWGIIGGISGQIRGPEALNDEVSKIWLGW